MPKLRKTDKKTGKNSSWYEGGSQNIFADLGHTQEEAANLLLRSDLLIEIASIIQKRKLSQTEAAKILKVKQPRISELMSGRIGKFKVDILINYLNRLGVRVKVVLKAMKNVA